MVLKGYTTIDVFGLGLGASNALSDLTFLRLSMIVSQYVVVKSNQVALSGPSSVWTKSKVPRSNPQTPRAEKSRDLHVSLAYHLICIITYNHSGHA